VKLSKRRRLPAEPEKGRPVRRKATDPAHGVGRIISTSCSERQATSRLRRVLIV